MDSLPSRERLYTLAELSEILNVSPRTARELVQTRSIESVKIGRQVRVSIAAVDEYVDNHTRKAVSSR